MTHQSSSSSDSAVWPLLKTAGKFVVGGAALGLGAAALANAVIAARTPSPGPRLNGLFDRYPARYSDVAYVVAGSGSPLLLLHGLDPGRSMSEWRHAFDLLADRHTVYALDWPGCGLSDPAPEGFDASGFAELVRHFVRDVIGAPTALLAAGHSAPLAALVADSDEAQISHLVLVCPQTLEMELAAGESKAETLAERSLSSGLLGLPVVSNALLNWRHSLPNLQRFATGRALFDKSLAEGESRIWHVGAHQKGAAPVQRARLQGDFAFDWARAWGASQVPALLVWGRNATGSEVESDGAPQWGALRPDADLHVMDQAMLMPHLERPEAFAESVLKWLAQQS